MSQQRDPYDWGGSWAWPAIERGDASSLAGLVLLQLAAHANRNGLAWPSGRKLAAMVGRTERRVRGALAELRDLGLIDGEPAAGRVTRWRLVADENEQRLLRDLRAATAEAGSAVGSWQPQLTTATQLRRNCDATADPGSAEGEGEGEEPLSPLNGSKDVREERVEFDPRNLVKFRRIGPT